MQQSDLNRIPNGLASGGNTDAPNGRNLVGAVNALLTVIEEAEEWGIADATNLPAEKQTLLEEAQEDLQYHLGELGPLLGSFVRNDGSITTESGNTFDLPKAASSGDSSATFPDNANN